MALDASSLDAPSFGAPSFGAPARKLPALVRFFAGLLVVAILFPTNGCEDRTGTFCECPSRALVVSAPEGTTFEVSGAGCTGSCQPSQGRACGVFLVAAETSTECTVRATRPGQKTQDSLFVTFADRSCCGLLPSPDAWTVGQAVDPEG